MSLLLLDANVTLYTAGEDLVAIDSFVQQNALANAYLAYLYDSQTAADPAARRKLATTPSLTLDQLIESHTHSAQAPAVYKTCLLECLQHTSDFDAVLIGLSDLYEQLRAVAHSLTGSVGSASQGDSQWVAPDWFQRSTTKYWVQPHDRMRVKCEIVKSLPVSIYGRQRHKLASGKSLHLHCTPAQNRQLCSQASYASQCQSFPQDTCKWVFLPYYGSL